MNRIELQQLAELRLQDAELLLAAQRWQAAYYLLGYSVECALKACVAKQFQLHEVPEKRLVNAFFTHRLDDLLAISGLKAALMLRASSDQPFSDNWDAVCEWTEASRYELAIPETQARDLHLAITDQNLGILPWLKTQW